EGVDGEEIARENLCLVMLHQLPPTDRRAPLWGREDAVPFQHLGNRLLTEVVTQLAQRPLDFAVPPIRILAHETDDECFDLSTSPWSSAACGMAIRPLPANQVVMPLQNRCGLEQTDYFSQLSGGMLRGCLQLGGHHRHRQFLNPGETHWLVPLAFQDHQLL